MGTYGTGRFATRLSLVLRWTVRVGPETGQRLISVDIVDGDTTDSLVQDSDETVIDLRCACVTVFAGCSLRVL